MTDLEPWREAIRDFVQAIAGRTQDEAAALDAACLWWESRANLRDSPQPAAGYGKIVSGTSREIGRPVSERVAVILTR